MTRETLVQRIKNHENACAGCPTTIFIITTIMELAEGILAVRDQDRKYTLYYDKERYQLRNDSPFSDESDKIPSLPKDTGFIMRATAQDWEDMFGVAQMSLDALEQDEIDWHNDPVQIPL